MKELSGSEQDCHKLRKFNTIIGDIESVIKCFELVVTIVELYKAEKVSEFWEDLIVPKEMENVLICYTKIFFFVSLLILHYEIVKENFIEFVNMFFD